MTNEERITALEKEVAVLKDKLEKRHKEQITVDDSLENIKIIFPGLSEKA